VQYGKYRAGTNYYVICMIVVVVNNTGKLLYKTNVRAPLTKENTSKLTATN